MQSALALPPTAAPTAAPPPAEPAPMATAMTAPSAPGSAPAAADSSMARLLGVPPAPPSTSEPLPAGTTPHLYHLGAVAFFLDHEELLLTAAQRTKLAATRETAVLGHATTQRKIDQAEQDLWSLTSADRPDANRVEAKLTEIARLSTQQRMDYIRAIGQAVAQLPEAQQKMLAMAPMGSAGAAAPSASGSMSGMPGMPMPMPAGTAAPSASGSMGGMPGMPMPMPAAPPASGSMSGMPGMPMEPPQGMPMKPPKGMGPSGGGSKGMGHM